MLLVEKPFWPQQNALWTNTKKYLNPSYLAIYHGHFGHCQPVMAGQVFYLTSPITFSSLFVKTLICLTILILLPIIDASGHDTTIITEDNTTNKVNFADL